MEEKATIAEILAIKFRPAWSKGNINKSKRKSKRLDKDPTRRFRVDAYSNAEYNLCHWCDHLLLFDEATTDHLIDKADGGTNRKVNLVIACKSCNGKRGHCNEMVRRGYWDKRSAAHAFLRYIERKKNSMPKS